MKARDLVSFAIFFFLFYFTLFSIPTKCAFSQERDEKIRALEGLSDSEKRKILEVMGETEETTVPVPPEASTKAPDIETPTPPPPKEAPIETPGLSEIEKIISGRFPTDISRELRLFGYNFFAKAAPTFIPVTNLPVGPDYIIGPGDSFIIHLWGKAEKTYDVTVTRDGRIRLPRLGTLSVNGLTFVELKRYLYRGFRKYYHDFEMSITMGRLRTVEIFIVGEAKNPGTYSVSSLSTVITALFAAGGPSKKGSLRKTNLFRNGKLIKTLDLYDFFIKGIKGNDIRLQPRDTIFIPIRGPVVGVAGFVKRPAIYEMKGTQTIGDMIELSGGLLPVGYLQNIVIERIKGHKRRVIMSFNLDPSHERTNKNLKTPLEDGDVIKIYPVHERIRQVVYLEGHVKYPREYELKPGMRLRDILPSYDYLLPEPYLSNAEIIRLMPPDLHPEIIQFNLGSLLAGEEDQNLLLQDLDRVIIYHKWEKKTIPEVIITGAVREPGAYRLYQNMRVKDLIFLAGNVTHKAYMKKATLTRVVPGERETENVELIFSPRKAMSGIPADNILLQEDDVVFIREIPKYTQTFERRVFLEGEFHLPGEYTFSEGERLSSVIERGGGLTDEAYPFGAVFQRESVKKVQQQRIREYISKLEEDILSMSALSAETVTDKDRAIILRESLSSKQQLIEKLKTSQPTGRMVINLEEVLADPSSHYNFEMKPGDRLIVTKKPDHVNVLGEVYNPTALFAEKGKRVGYYINLVGGITENAEEDEIYLVKANGTVLSKSQEGFFGVISWNSKEHRWNYGGAFESAKMDPGDTIIVPKKVVRYPWLRVVKDITQIMYQIAVSAGVLITATK